MAVSVKTILTTVRHMTVTMELVLTVLTVSGVSVILVSMVHIVRWTLMNVKVSFKSENILYYILCCGSILSSIQILISFISN